MPSDSQAVVGCAPRLPPCPKPRGSPLLRTKTFRTMRTQLRQAVITEESPRAAESGAGAQRSYDTLRFAARRSSRAFARATANSAVWCAAVPSTSRWASGRGILRPTSCVVLIDEEYNQGAHDLDGVEGVEEEQLMLDVLWFTQASSPQFQNARLVFRAHDDRRRSFARTEYCSHTQSFWRSVGAALMSSGFARASRLSANMAHNS
jgi:hypothetical protein